MERQRLGGVYDDIPNKHRRSKLRRKHGLHCSIGRKVSRPHKRTVVQSIKVGREISRPTRPCLFHI